MIVPGANVGVIRWDKTLIQTVKLSFDGNYVLG